MSDLGDFLLARIAEDEEQARPMVCLWPYDGGWSSTHVARVLAQCAAKHRIVEQHDETHECPQDGDSSGWWDGVPCGVLRRLSLPYADHPDYREKWRP